MDRRKAAQAIKDAFFEGYSEAANDYDKRMYAENFWRDSAAKIEYDKLKSFG